MSSQVFYRKWRPQTLKEVVGQEPVTRTLLNALSSGRVSHAYLFCGPRGTGKTSTGRILAKAINCQENGQGEPCNHCAICQAITEGRSLDVIEIDAASNTGVDDIRSLREKITFSPNESRRKVYIIDEVHMLSNSASNALLKTLEEPPPHAIFILATTEIHKVLPTIISRCQRFDFRRISQADLVTKLAYICQQEGIKVEPEGLKLIARSARGSFRDAENLLQQITTYYGSEVALHQVQATLGITGDARVKELAGHIVSGNLAAGIGTIQRVSNDGLDLKQFNRELVAILRELLLVKTGAAETAGLADTEHAELKDLAGRASLGQILNAVKLFGKLESGFDQYSTLPLELAMVDCALASGEAASPVKPRTPEAAAPSIPEKARPPAAKKVTPDTAPKTAPPATEAKPPVVKEKPATNVEPRIAAAPKIEPPVINPEPAAEAELGSELTRLQSHWKKLIEEAPPEVRKSNAAALLRSGGVKVASISDNTVVLAFRHTIHKDQIEKPENQRIVESLISRYLNRPCQVRCTCEPEKDHLVRAVQNMGAQITSVEEK
ncbi:MAG: DNA polymerase III subunit gamma/tau [Chloroflexota bacterium]